MNKKLVTKILLVVFAVIFVFMMSFAIYASIYYHSNTKINDITEVTVSVVGDNIYLTPSDDYTQAIIFYPGGKVEPEAYLPLMAEIASRGILTVICEMPYNLAVFDVSRATLLLEINSGLDCYLMGHSLGGAMAASYAAKHPQSLNGLILLAAYSTKTVNIPTLSIYGSLDNILDLDKYDECLPNLTDVEEYIIPGGNHSQFGDYGLQRKDNESTISMATQIAQTADKVVEFIDAH